MRWRKNVTCMISGIMLQSCKVRRFTVYLVIGIFTLVLRWNLNTKRIHVQLKKLVKFQHPLLSPRNISLNWTDTGIVLTLYDGLKFPENTDASLESNLPSVAMETREGRTRIARGNSSAEEVEHARIMAKLNITLVRNDTCSGCFKHVFNYVISGDGVCSSGTDIDLVLLITTTHDNFPGRQALRRSWLTYVKHLSKIRYVFLLGETINEALRSQVAEEHLKYGDIVKEDFVDSYANLTLKTIMGLKWATQKCPRAQYVMKTDDDMFIILANLLKILHNPYIRERLETSVMGDCWQNKPYRNIKSKYYVSYESYPHLYFPPFCSGTGYVMHMRTAKKIFKMAPNIPFFHLEDVYVGMCLQSIGLGTYNHTGFSVLSTPPGCFRRWRSIYSIQAGSYMNVQRIWNNCN